MPKKMSIAFVWHMHQPVYQEYYYTSFIMPWVRFHAIKDYLDMLCIIEKFPNLKLNFNLCPILINAFEKYVSGVNDIHAELTLKPINELSDEDKLFIINHFFDINYNTVISKYPLYKKLYDKRYSRDDIGIDDFSNQEYSDIMYWYNVCWFDPSYIKLYPHLLPNKEHFTLEDRIFVIEFAREIISKIIPTYKKYQDEGKIEISTSPFYHPILPLLIDIQEAKDSQSKYPLPVGIFNMQDDAHIQIKTALDKIEKIFGKRPQGIWPSELCLNDKTLDLLCDNNIKWTISDENILSNSINKEFIKDIQGFIKDPYDLTKSYEYHHNDKKIDIIFRDATIPNLIGFEYPKYNSKDSAKNLYERIKTIQSKLKNSPDENHLLTIAMDGENAWENYEKDGEDFLFNLYDLICKDKTLETVLISDFLDKSNEKKQLKSLHSISRNNPNYKMWIAEPTKNLAWKYLDKTRNDLLKFIQEGLTQIQINDAKREIYVSEGSDWFWWYGEPNDSGQDHIFDYLFREHLKNVYMICKKPIPAYLETPLTSFQGYISRYPRKLITPPMDGIKRENDEWLYSGCINTNTGLTLRKKKFFHQICFGCDPQNLYLRFEINPEILDENKKFSTSCNIFIYIKNDKYTNASSIRQSNMPDYIFPIMKDKYTNEIFISFFKDELYNPQLSHAIDNNLWVKIPSNSVKYVFTDFMDITIPFNDIGVKIGEEFEFFIILASMSYTQEVYPQDFRFKITRP